MAATKDAHAPAEIKAAEDIAHKVTSHQDRSQPATPERETVPPTSKATVSSPAAPQPSSPETTEQHYTVNIGEMEWPQLVTTGSAAAHEPSQQLQQTQTLEDSKARATSQNDENSAKVAAQQIESMMKGLADEDEPTPETASQDPPLTLAGVIVDTEEQPAAFLQHHADGAQLLAGHGNSHVRAPQSWNLNAPVYDGAASLPADPNYFAEETFPVNGLAGTDAPEGMQTFTVAFTVQGSGTICVNAATGQAAIEQLQYNTSLQGGLAGLLSYAKCATMFQVIE